MISIIYNSLLILALLPIASGFQPISISSNRALFTTTSTTTNQLPSTSTMTTLHEKVNQDDDFPKGGESYEGDVDWDAEWKKVMEKKKNQPLGGSLSGTPFGGNGNDVRPGKYKNDVERALLQTTKATSEQIKKVKIVKPDFNMSNITSDAKFWIAILAILSVGISLISAAGVEQYANSSETFYV